MKTIFYFLLILFVISSQISCSSVASKKNNEDFYPIMAREDPILSKKIVLENNNCYPKEITDTFLASDAEAIASIKIKHFRGFHTIKWNWETPYGSIYYSTGIHSISAKEGKLYKEITALHRLKIKNTEAADYRGVWKVKVFLDNEEITPCLSFQIKDIIKMSPPMKKRPKPERSKVILINE